MKKNTIKVAQIIGTVFDGGVESVIMNYFKHIDRESIQFTFFVERTSKIIDRELIESLDGKIVIVPHYTHLLKYIAFLYKEFRNEKYDIVHSNNGTLAVFDLFAAYLAKIKIRIVHIHSMSSSKEPFRHIIKTILKPFSQVFATDYFACSNASANWFYGKKLIDKNKITIVNNAVEMDRFRFNTKKRLEVRKNLNVEDCIVIGNIGRFVKTKNQSFLLDVFSKVACINNKIKLMIIGEGPLKNVLQNKVKELSIEDNVIFVSTVVNIQDYYSAMDLFCLPSLYEGFPMCGIEAQINGLPCIFSNNVPEETNISNFVDYLQLDVDKWLNKICERIETKRKLNIQIDRKYDIDYAAKELEKKYEALIRK